MRAEHEGLVRASAERNTSSWPCEGWSAEPKPKTEGQLALRTRGAPLFTLLKSLSLEKCKQYTGTVVGARNVTSAWLATCHQRKGSSRSLFPLIVLQSLGSLDRENHKFTSINNTNVHFLISSIGYLLPGLQICPNDVHSLQQPRYSAHLLCAWPPCRHWANKITTPSLILCGFAG